MIRWFLALSVIAAAGAGAAVAATTALNSGGATVKTAANAKFGTVLVGSTGKTLYRYTVDSKGVNRCTSNAACNKYWPPLLVKATAKPIAGGGASASLIGTIKAAHGMRQVTYAGFPLYFFAGDTKAGETSGQGFQSQWYVVNTKGAFVKHAVSTGSTGGTASAAPTTTGDGYTWG